MRLKRSNEILQGIKMVKVQALEDVFFDYINVIRRKELWQMVKAATLIGFMCKLFKCYFKLSSTNLILIHLTRLEDV